MSPNRVSGIGETYLQIELPIRRVKSRRQNVDLRSCLGIGIRGRRPVDRWLPRGEIVAVFRTALGSLGDCGLAHVFGEGSVDGVKPKNIREIRAFRVFSSHREHRFQSKVNNDPSEAEPSSKR